MITEQIFLKIFLKTKKQKTKTSKTAMSKSTFILPQLHAKQKYSFNTSIRYITQKTHFESSARFFRNKPFESILSHYSTVTSCKKIRKVSCTDFLQNLKKTHFGPTFCPFWLQNFKIKFPKKTFCSVLSLNPTSCKNLQRFYAPTFDNT